MESVNLKITALLWLCYIKKKKKKIKESAEGRHSLEPEKARLTSEILIVAKFGGHVLHCLASSLSNVVRQVNR